MNNNLNKSQEENINNESETVNEKMKSELGKLLLERKKYLQKHLNNH